MKYTLRSMSCDSGHNVAGGSEMAEEPQTAQAMESGSSSCSPPGEEGGSSHCFSSPASPQERRSHFKCFQQRLLTSNVACQTDYTDEWSPMTKVEAEAVTDTASSSSEGTLRLMIQNFKSMTDTVRGPSKEIQGVNWRIMVMPRQHVVQKKGTQKCLGFFLQCCPEAYSDQWSCQAQAELRLISQKTNVPHFTRKTNHNYTAKENDWGYSCFMTWADILDENQGYIKEDRVILEVTVKADPPKNILSHDDFKKSIQNWRELAELQFQRNCIDLAIEANMQALKFCKDRDQEIKMQLEEQKNFFIEQKVKESIQRIEKGKDVTQRADDEGTSQTALRQALTANNTRHNHTKKDKTRKTKKQRPREPSPPSPSVTPPPVEVRVEEKPKTEKAATVKANKGTEKTENASPFVLEGHFNKNMRDLFRSRYEASYDPRPRDEEDIYTLARHITDQLQHLNLSADKDVFPYVQNMPEADSESIMIEQHHFFQQMLEQNAFEQHQRRKMKMERKIRGAEEALSFREFIERQFREHPHTKDEVDEEVKNMVIDLDPIFMEESRAYRDAIIDRQPEDAFASAAFFLWSDDDPYLWAEEDFYSERDSTVSSDSDRQYDGCIKAKRSKRDNNHFLNEPCRCVDKFAVPVCEMGVQTDVVPQKQKCETEKMPSTDTTKNNNSTTVAPPAPAGRILKKPTSKKNKTKMNEAAAVSPVPASVVPSQAPVPVVPFDHSAMMNPQQFPIVEGENVVNFGTFKIVASPLDKMDDVKGHSVIPRVLPMEYAMKFFPNAIAESEDQMNGPDPNKIMEDWVRTWLIEAQKIKPADGTNASTNPQDFLSQYSEQVVTALSAVAMNFMNVRRVVQKMNEIVMVLNERTSVLRLSKVHGALFTLAGMSGIASGNEITFNPVAREVDGDYVLVEQLNYMDEVKAKIEEQIATDKETAKKINQAMKQVEERFTSNNKAIKELEKKFEEADKTYKKIEKATKNEINTLKNQLATEKDRNQSLAKDLKEKNKEVKRLENKYSTAATERDEYFEKMKTVQKEMTAAQKKHSEEVGKLRREMSNLNESRKHLQSGIGERDNEIKSLNHQIEERTNNIKKQKSEIDQERQKVAALNQQLQQAVERAKKAEIDMLSKELESGVALLERAHLDATKQRHEMQEAAASRARNQVEMNNYINSRNDWNAIVEQIEGFIKKAKTEYTAQIEQIGTGKPLSSLPRISVPKPPMPPTIIKVPPIVSVEPTKPTPGVIGSRPVTHMGPSTISPQSRAPGSPVQKPQLSPGSPVRHPGAIGTRPNGVPVNGSSAERNNHDSSSVMGTSNNTSNGGSILNSWAWPETIASINDVVASSSNDLLSMTTPSSRVDQNGWDEQNNTWSSNHTSNLNPYMSSLGGPTRSSAFREPPGWTRPQSAQQQPTLEQQRMMYLNSPWPIIVDRVAKKLHIDQELAFGLTRQYLGEHNINLMRVNPEEVADAIIQKRYSESQRLPPGAAPGYLQNPLMGSFMDRNPIGPPLGSILNNQEHMLNSLLGTDSIRPSSTADKWSTGL